MTVFEQSQLTGWLHNNKCNKPTADTDRTKEKNEKKNDGQEPESEQMANFSISNRVDIAS